MLALLFFFFAVQFASTESQNVIDIAIDTDNGQVICSLYSSLEDFPKNDKMAIAHSKSPIASIASWGGHMYLRIAITYLLMAAITHPSALPQD